MLVKKKLKKRNLKPRPLTPVRRLLNLIDTAYRFLNPFYKTVTLDLTEKEMEVIMNQAKKNGMTKHQFFEYTLGRYLDGIEKGLYYDEEV